MDLKKPYTLDEQIKKLKDHGVVISDDAFARNVLQKVSYYRLSGYINYIGNFKDGKKDGQGKEFDNWGNLIYEGLFSNDKRVE